MSVPTGINGLVLAEFNFICSAPNTETFLVVKGSLYAHLAYRALSTDSFGLALLFGLVGEEVNVRILAS